MKRGGLLAMLLIAAACTPTGRPLTSDNPFIGSRDRPNVIRIEVQNLNFADARLSALRDGGSRISLGTVGGKQDRTFSVDWPMIEDIRIEINLLAGQIGRVHV